MRKNSAMAAFWSIDAAFALVLAVAMFAMFSAMLYAAGASVARGAEDASGSLLSVRFSAYALQQLEAGGAPDLQWALGRTGREYASVRAGNEFAEIGARGADIYCTQRLMVREGKMVKVEACIG